MLVDSHCHLDFPELRDDLEGVLQRARAAGVGCVVTISTLVGRFDVYRALSEGHDTILFTVGTHPHQAAAEPDVSADRLAGLAEHPRCIAIGEAGLDYHHERSPRDVQAKVLRAHVEAARRTGLPLVIHARDADADMAAILTQEMERGPFTGVLHCFSSGRGLAETGLALGLHLSFSGILTFKRSTELREIAARTPRDRILVETDAPYMAPEPHRGRVNEPAHVVRTASALAGALGLTDEEVARLTTANFRRLFSKARLPA